MDGKEDFKIFSAKWEGEMSKTTLRVNNRPRRFLRFGYRVQTTKSAEASAEAAFPVPPRRAHDTLQPQDESIIVGYYTFAKVSLRTASPYNTNKTQEVNAYGKRRWYPSYKCKKRKIS